MKKAPTTFGNENGILDLKTLPLELETLPDGKEVLTVKIGEDDFNEDGFMKQQAINSLVVQAGGDVNDLLATENLAINDYESLPN